MTETKAPYLPSTSFAELPKHLWPLLAQVSIGAKDAWRALPDKWKVSFAACAKTGDWLPYFTGNAAAQLWILTENKLDSDWKLKCPTKPTFRAYLEQSHYIPLASGGSSPQLDELVDIFYAYAQTVFPQ